MKVLDLYNSTIKPLTPAERLQLARLILGDIAPPGAIDASDEWSDEDLREFTRAGWEQIEDANQSG